MTISFNQRSFLGAKAKNVIEDLDYDLLWKATENLEEEEYRFALAAYYNDKSMFKHLIKELMYP